MLPRKNSLEKPAIAGGKAQRNKYLTFGAPFLGEDEIEEVVDSLKSGWLSTGPKVAQFENSVKKYLGCRYALALNSCTAAMHLSLIAGGIGKDDEVITSPLTFSATANVILHVGAKPVFVDVEKTTGNIDARLVERYITKNTKAIMPVHLYGRPCEMDTITKIARKHKLFVIEDAAHGFGASYKGAKIGTISDFTCFSFYVTKNLITGEGGLVATDRKKWADAIEMYALHGMTKGAWKRYSDSGYSHYLIKVPGFKYNMMDIQAALGIHQLRKFDAMQKKRAQIWEIYNKGLQGLPIELPKPIESGNVHAFHLYTIQLCLDKLKVSRDFILQALHKENIGAGVHFISLHMHPFYKKLFNFKKNDFPNASYISDRTISLPLSAKLSEKDVSDVVFALRKILLYYKR